VYLYSINLIQEAMKKFSLFLTVILLTSFPLFIQQVTAQNTDADKEKEYKIQKEIEQQKKAMWEQKKVQEESLKALQKSQEDMQKSLDQINVMVEVPDVPEPPDFDTDDNIVRVYTRRGDRGFSTGEPFVMSSDSQGSHYFMYGDNAERTRWDFSKNVKESTFSKEYSFDVEKTSKSVVMSINGDCKTGEIRIKITMPNGKTYSEILIDESGNLNWRKSFSITDTENQDKKGEWKYQISANKATGYFKISLQTN
jgi:uncharacterized FlaG/YvyC family protein